QSLLDAPIIKKGDYPYVVHPITDGVPEIKSELLKEIIEEMEKRIKKCGSFDKIVTIEAMGIPLASTLSLKIKVPFVIIRKRSYGLTGEINVEQTTGYSKSKLYINGLKKGDKIVIVDDVLSTGGTLSAIISTLKNLEVIIKGIFIVVNKGNASKKIIDKFKTKIDILANIDIVEGKVVIKEI
ncbi:MAG: adenine phosphoribosyltransferase, partial [Thermoplasmatales archaeon SG8-52-3]